MQVYLTERVFVHGDMARAFYIVLPLAQTFRVTCSAG